MKAVHSVLSLLGIFGIFTTWLYFLSQQFDSNNVEIHFPKDLEDLKNLSASLRQHQQDNFALVFLLFCSAYIYKQTFAIPGSVFMNILAGALLGTWIAFPLVCILTAMGASCCFLLSKTFGRDLLLQRFSDRILAWQNKLQENHSRLFFFLLSVRLFPASPNWFLNMTSPIVGVPIKLFFISVLFGLMPYNFICVQTGSVLSSINSLDDIFSTTMFLSMLLVAAAVFLPGILMGKISRKHEN
uniref:Transmembrane protein 41A-A-like n=1 Tax=Phallusia mammillata TaxID=59560 RepID=A0A6F9DVN1_9ASCI|nr:transmembrane protein 41A-A-like [Phallusia mammillata]